MKLSQRRALDDIENDVRIHRAMIDAITQMPPMQSYLVIKDKCLKISDGQAMDILAKFLEGIEARAAAYGVEIDE